MAKSLLNNRMVGRLWFVHFPYGCHIHFTIKLHKTRIIYYFCGAEQQIKI